MKLMNKFWIGCAIALGLTSCAKDLDLRNNNNVTDAEAYKDATSYKAQLAKVYASFALTSSQGPNSGDLGGIDPGTSDFLRLYWGAQELTTDEAACSWIGDAGVGEFDYNTWNSSNIFLNGLYTRSIYQITIANDFIRHSEDAVLASKGITGDSATLIKTYSDEAKFVRAYQYWVLMDLFGNPPFIDENSAIGTTAPQQIKRADLFSYVVGQLRDVESGMVTARQNEYGRADQGACDALLARIYLNSEIYTGQKHYDSAAYYANKVINDGYTLKDNYAQLFMGDNDKNNNEAIWTINYDGLNTRNFGGTTYLINAAVNGAMTPANFGIPNGGWGGNRSRSPLPNIFTNANDKRSMFWTSSTSTTEIKDMSQFTQGYAVSKFTNMESTGVAAPSTDGSFCSTDFPVFRLAEMYLIEAEATLRNGGSASIAAGFINKLRERAYGDASGDVTTVSLDDILNERMRELYWEGSRRTDLIRYGKYTGSSYLWPWKGGVAAGQAIESYRSIFPLPNTDVIANSNLTQNPGY